MQNVYAAEEFDFASAKIGDLVTAEVVMNGMNIMPPATMRLACAQMGEPYSHRLDPLTGKLRATYATFRCVEGDFNAGTWEYQGNCFRGETTERGEDPYYSRSA